MMKTNLSQHIRPRQGMALVVVLTVVVLITSLLVAFLVSVRTDRKSSEIYAGSVSTRLLAESALNLSMAQVKAATAGEDAASGTLAWASQPGMIRSFSTNGSLHRAYKLYTWPNMTATTFSANDAAEQPPADWASKPALFTDLNAPQRGSYPIMNPAAIGKVEGFEIAGAPGTDATAPVMPVYWLYQLEDGTVVVPEAGANDDEVRVPGATGDNPIVGRMAFWTDDESSKLNINTSSEGQFWDSPRFLAPRELHMANSQPAKFEFQRYPGHPYTTSLSPVLAAYMPGGSMGDSFIPPIQTASPFLSTLPAQDKEVLDTFYKIAPRVAWGGSEAGTIPFNWNTSVISGEDRDDRLYTTVDELAFVQPTAPGRDRTELVSTPLAQEDIEEVGFFLTASSRAPEVNLFGQPRVTIWPIDDHTRLNPARQAVGQNSNSRDPAIGEPDQRSPLDKLIAFCSTIGRVVEGKTFFFNRADPLSPTADFRAGSRNEILFNYLRGFLGQPVPGFGGVFSTKYSSDSDQILFQIVDYIRATNVLYAAGDEPDNVRNADFKHAFTTPPTPFGGGAFLRHALSQAGGITGGPGSRNLGTPSSSNPPLTAAFGSHAAGGQVIPLRHSSLNGPDGEPLKGFGKFPTISQAGFMFIVQHASPRDTNGRPNYVYIDTGDGLRWRPYVAGGANMPPLGAIGSGFPQVPTKYYENQTGLADVSVAGKVTSPFDESLPDGHIRMQIVLLIDPFHVAPGFPGAHPDYRVTVTGLNGMRINGSVLERPFVDDRSLIMAGSTSLDNPIINTVSAWSAIPGLPAVVYDRELNNAEDQNRLRYPFFASATVPVTAAASTFLMEGPPPPDPSAPRNPVTLELEIETNGGYGSFRSGNYENDPVLIQTLEMDFPSGTFPAPVLSTLVGGADFERTVAMRHLGRHVVPQPTDTHWNDPVPFYGRFMAKKNASATDPKGGGGAQPNWLQDGTWARRFILPETDAIANQATADTVRTVQIGHGDVRLIAARSSVPKSEFVPHPDYFSSGIRSAHSFRYGNTANRYWGAKAGRLIDSASPDYPQETNEPQRLSIFPLVSPTVNPAVGSTKPPFWDEAGDWDTGLTRMVDGPFINKPDEGDGGRADADGVVAGIPYFSQLGARGWFSVIGANRVSPNRIMPSAVMFGSLPTGVFSGRPWQTLVFSPNPRSSSHIGLTNPPDHLILDLFTMPVVEPYAISEPFSTAGKVNMNYRMVPFGHIRRDTALRGVFKAVKLTAVPTSQIGVYKGDRSTDNTTPKTSDLEYRYSINADETLKGFDERFDNGSGPGVFKSASEICEMFLYPDSQTTPGTPLVNFASGDSAIRTWWADKQLTGDNMREQPYAVIYPRLTTKSNTFTVHMKVETLTKVKSDADQDIWREGRDVVRAQYRGSATFERFIDPNEEGLPDYATASNPPPLDEFYRFRIVSVKEFQP